jgi:hypothetical protein
MNNIKVARIKMNNIKDQINNDSRIQELDIQISNLHKERSSIIETYKMDEILSLKWTEECSAELLITGFFAAGIPKYKILLSENAPYSPNPIRIMSDSILSESSLMIYSSKSYDNGPCFYTSSNQTLIQFLKIVQFKSFQYDTNLLKLLLNIKEIVDSKY